MIIPDCTSGATSRSMTTRVKSSSGLPRAIQSQFFSQCCLKDFQNAPPPLPITMIDRARGAIASTRYWDVTAASYRSDGVAAIRLSPLLAAAARILLRIESTHSDLSQKESREASSAARDFFEVFSRARIQTRLDLNCCSPSGHEPDQEQHQEDEEENFRDSRRRSGDAAETENTGDNRYNQKYQRVVKHFDSSKEAATGPRPALAGSRRLLRSYDEGTYAKIQEI